MQRIAVEVVKKLQSAGHIAYFTGGWVRDYLMGHESDDIDIATSASPEQVQQLFEKTIPVGLSFGIVVVVEQGYQYEIATFRKDLEYVDGRHPLVALSVTPEQDALRRDFTINGMFYDPVENKIYDFVSGKEDLHLRVVRAIGDAGLRFREDRLRMIRAVRYATRFDFAIDKGTKRAILEHASTLFPAVSIERVWQEFCKMAKFNTFGKSLYMLYEFHLLVVIFPLLISIPDEEIKVRCDKIEELPKDLPVVGAIMEICSPKKREEVSALCKFLKLSSKEEKFALGLFDARLQFGSHARFGAVHERFEIAKFLSQSDSEAILTFMAHDFSEEKRSYFLASILQMRADLAFHIACFKENKPLISAIDLQEMGVENGVKMGQMLKMAARIAVNEDITSKEALLGCKAWRKYREQS